MNCTSRRSNTNPLYSHPLEGILLTTSNFQNTLKSHVKLYSFSGTRDLHLKRQKDLKKDNDSFISKKKLL